MDIIAAFKSHSMARRFLVALASQNDKRGKRSPGRENKKHAFAGMAIEKSTKEKPRKC